MFIFKSKNTNYKFLRFFVFSLVISSLLFSVGFNFTNEESLIDTNSAQAREGNTYYVSPDGSDDNPGLEKAPWKTMYHAAQNLRAGDTAIFEDGDYTETRQVRFRYNGLKNAPITIKSKNKHGAKIVFRLGKTNNRIYIEKEHITIKDFDISQHRKREAMWNKLIGVYPGGDNVKIIGNKIHNTHEDGIKTYRVSNLLIEGNIIYDINHEAIDLCPAFNSIIRDNEIYDIGRIGILIKGGSKKVDVYNNFLHNNRQMEISGYAISLGGSLGPANEDPANDYTAYNCRAWNNIIFSETPGKIIYGVVIIGAKDSAVYNNLIFGAQHGFYTKKVRYRRNRPDGTKIRGPWVRYVKNPTFKNNIVSNCTDDATIFRDIEGGLELDYNLYYNCPNAPIEEHGIYKNPLFENPIKWNFHLTRRSPAIDNGTDVGLRRDYDEEYRPRGSGWDIGPFEYQF